MSETMTKEQIEHFYQAAKWEVEQGEDDPCFIWNGLINAAGAPSYRPKGGQQTSAYRYAHLADGGQLEPGQRVQRCPRHRYCVRGSHLTVKTGRRRSEL